MQYHPTPLPCNMVDSLYPPYPVAPVQLIHSRYPISSPPLPCKMVVSLYSPYPVLPVQLIHSRYPELMWLHPGAESWGLVPRHER